MAKAKTPKPNLLTILRALEKHPPTTASQTIARHLKCKKSQELSHMVMNAIEASTNGNKGYLDAPSEFLPPLG